MAHSVCLRTTDHQSLNVLSSLFTFFFFERSVDCAGPLNISSSPHHHYLLPSHLGGLPDDDNGDEEEEEIRSGAYTRAQLDSKKALEEISASPPAHLSPFHPNPNPHLHLYLHSHHVANDLSPRRLPNRPPHLHWLSQQQQQQQQQHLWTTSEHHRHHPEPSPVTVPHHSYHQQQNPIPPAQQPIATFSNLSRPRQSGGVGFYRPSSHHDVVEKHEHNFHFRGESLSTSSDKSHGPKSKSPRHSRYSSPRNPEMATTMTTTTTTTTTTSSSELNPSPSQAAGGVGAAFESFDSYEAGYSEEGGGWRGRREMQQAPALSSPTERRKVVRNC